MNNAKKQNSLSLAQSSRNLLVLAAVLVGLVVYSFSGAQTWTSPVATPPDANTETPINVGATTQTKAGNLIVSQRLTAKDITANWAMDAGYTISWSQSRANAYCDLSGNNCIAPWTIQPKVWGTCPVGQSIRQVNGDGSVVCQSSGGISGCKLEATTKQSCGNSPPPACPAGYVKASQVKTSKCSANDDWEVATCIRSVCS